MRGPRAAAVCSLAWLATACGGDAPTGPVGPTPPSAADPAFTIEIRYAAGPVVTGARRDAFDEAARRWERVVTGDLPDVPIDRPSGTCGSPDPISERVDDLLIIVTIEAIDGRGGVLGTAGPCMVRSGSRLPLAGTMRLDAADLDALEGDLILGEILLHEMGHVLGIGTLWRTHGLLADPAGSGGSDPHFTGSAAIAAFDAIGGSAYAAPKVPVEDTGPAGTRDVHWRESVFAGEIMTGWIDAGYTPVSRVTIASLADLGYAVDPDAGQSVGLALSPSVAPRSGGGRAVRLRDDVWRGPIEVVSPSGGPRGTIPR